MKPIHCIAVDMGASSIRIVLGTIDDDSLKYKEIYRFENAFVQIGNTLRWDIEAIYENIILGINKAIKQYPRIESIGVDSWGVDYALLDSENNLIEKPYSYRDERSDGMMEQWEVLMSRHETFRRTGINFYNFNTLFQLLASKDSQELKIADSLLFIPSYINYRLCGVIQNEATIASTSQLLKVDSSEIDDVIVGKIGIKSSLFKDIVDPPQIISNINDNKINSKNIQVTAVASHDTASAIAAIPSTSENKAYIATGTWCIVGIESKMPILSKVSLDNGFTNERGVFNTYRTLKNIPGLWIIQKLQKELPDNYSFSEMENMAQQAKNTRLIIDPETPGFYNPPNMISAMKEFLVNTKQGIPKDLGEYIMCAYYSLCLTFAYYIEKLESLSNNTFDTIHMIGGGSQSALLCQSTSDFLGKKVVSGPVEAALLGNILLQAIAHGKISDIIAGKLLIENSFPTTVYTPNNKDCSKIKNKYNAVKHSLCQQPS
jgi:rhamnulokinase